jgi:hypothetical protein
MLQLLFSAGLVLAASSAGSGQRSLVGKYVTVQIGNASECVVTDFGAKGDGKTDDTAAIQVWTVSGY